MGFMILLIKFKFHGVPDRVSEVCTNVLFVFDGSLSK